LDRCDGWKRKKRSSQEKGESAEVEEGQKKAEYERCRVVNITRE
jgi:hypothetical protein